MYDSTTFSASDQLAGRTPPARLGAIPGRVAPAAHRRSPRRVQRSRQPVAQPGQVRWPPSPAPPQASRPQVQVDPPAAAPVAGIAGPKTPGLGLSRRRVDPAQSDPGHPTPLRGPIPPFPGGAHPQAVQLEPPEASETCQPAGRRRHPALERGALACPEKKARDEGRTIVFVDETGCYLLPLVVRTYAPRGQTPLLRAPLSRDHLSVISGITAHGWLHTKVQDRPFRGRVEECHLSASGSAILRVGQGHQAAQAKAPHHSCLHCSGWSCLTLCSWVSKMLVARALVCSEEKALRASKKANLLLIPCIWSLTACLIMGAMRTPCWM